MKLSEMTLTELINKAEKQRISETNDEMEYYDGAIDFLIWVLDKKVIK